QRDPFVVRGGTLWDGRTLHELYQEACMPWEWQPRLQKIAHDLGMDFFSSPFDATAVDFLEEMDVPAHKVASFEMIDIPLLQKIAATGKPIIMSTGMATLEEIEEALATLRAANSGPVALLKCTSAYPADPAEMNLKTIPEMERRFGVPVGLSDHTMGHTVAVAAVALGAVVVEKHFILSRSQPGPDSSFSMEPQEFREMVDMIRITEKAIGRATFDVSGRDAKSRAFRRSLFIAEDVKKGDIFNEANVRCVRPANGLHPRHLTEVLGRRAATDLIMGTPLEWDHIAND
ncbi:MAG TPA: pseudaminic acid synthase, partial [Prosthecobacter sp.]|nr:pseudaminic acid synthase [Prosthecobacter sp.]